MPDSHQSDSRETERLLARAADGDREAFDRLFELHRTSLKRLVSLRMDGRLKARLDPSDIVQETQMVAYRRFQDYLDRRPMPFRLWLRKTAQQQVYDAQRNHIDRRRRSLLREEGPLNRSSILIARGLLSDRSSPRKNCPPRARAASRRRRGRTWRDRPRNRRHAKCRRPVVRRNRPSARLAPPAVRQRYGRALIKLRSKLKDRD